MFYNTESFLWSLCEKKRSRFQNKKRDTEYPTQKTRNLFGKMLRKEEDKDGTFWQRGYTYSIRKNAFPTVARKCIFARKFHRLSHPNRVGTEIFQIMKKAFVLGHSLTKQAPQ